MSVRQQVFKCGVCGNMVEILHEGAGELTCCGKAMIHLEENTVDAAKEKHVPIVETTPEGIKVKVGGVSHPMEEKHYIEFIELLTPDRTYCKFLKPGDPPEALFCVDAWPVTAREHCNLHGLWKS